MEVKRSDFRHKFASSADFPMRMPRISISRHLFRGTLDSEQLDFKDQGTVGADLIASASLAIRQTGRNKNLPLIAFLHQLKGLGPSRNDAVHRE